MLRLLNSPPYNALPDFIFQLNSLKYSQSWSWLVFGSASDFYFSSSKAFHNIVDHRHSWLSKGNVLDIGYRAV